MAAMGYTEQLHFASKWQQTVKKMILGINDMYWTLRMRIWFHKQSKCSDVCNMAAILQYGRHR